MSYPQDLKYTKEHEWVRDNSDGSVTIGITHYAQDHLGEVVFVELPDVGEEFTTGDSFGVVESVKSVSDVFVPLSGKVVEINEPLSDSPELINDDCYGEGWMVKIALKDKTELGQLMDAPAYEAHLKAEAR